jgi:hypothetical protein
MGKVVAISGWAKSGKDTSADYLISNGYKRVAFADVLKEMVAEQYSIPLQYCHNQDLKEKPLEQYPVMPKDAFSLAISKLLFNEFRTIDGRKAAEPYIDPSGAFLGSMYDKAGGAIVQLYWTPRALCILEGSIKRSVDSSYWVGRAIQKIDKALQEGHNVVISDLRYRSETDQLRQAFNKNLTTVRINRFDSTPSTDASENDLNNSKFDVTIENRGTLDNLIFKLDMEILNQ